MNKVIVLLLFLFIAFSSETPFKRYIQDPDENDTLRDFYLQNRMENSKSKKIIDPMTYGTGFSNL
uniref:Secreted peptide prohormone 17 n=1 Tax=Schmidtea mediterranea TaxID=79327 RepID=E3T7U5_SCHMD|nr:secreted peptide prohormone 17 [Schmidtea mediterranea]